jgi:hypothetical protein
MHETRHILLPINQLSWPNVDERFFLRLLARTRRVHTANLFGTAGQARELSTAEEPS